MKILGEDKIVGEFYFAAVWQRFWSKSATEFSEKEKFFFEIGRNYEEQRSSCTASPLHIDVILLKMAEITAQRPFTHSEKIICCKRWDRTQLD